MPDETPNLDANQSAPADAAPSPADAIPPAAPSPAPDANQAEPVKDFAELAIEAFNAQRKPSAPSTELPTDPAAAPAGEGDIRLSNKTAEEPPQAAVVTVPPVETPKIEDFSNLPFHKHERFQALVKERAEFKAANDAARPQIERLTAIDQFMAQNRISVDQFKQALEIQALINTAPETALERLEPLYKHLQEFKGQVLPTDLKDEVDAGTLPLARAQEIAKLRKQTQFKEQVSQQTARDSNAERLMTALSSWEDTARRTDPDYERKKNFVLNRFVALSAQQPWQTAEQAVGLAKRAYDEVNTELGTFVPKPKATKNPPVNGHSAAAKPAFTSWDQADDFARDVLTRRRR